MFDTLLENKEQIMIKLTPVCAKWSKTEGNNGRISVNPSRSNSRMTKTLIITLDEKWLPSSDGLFTVDIPTDKYVLVSLQFYRKKRI